VGLTEFPFFDKNCKQGFYKKLNAFTQTNDFSLPYNYHRRWRELVADRKKWKDIVRQAKAHSGL